MDIVVLHEELSEKTNQQLTWHVLSIKYYALTNTLCLRYGAQSMQYHIGDYFHSQPCTSATHACTLAAAAS